MHKMHEITAEKFTATLHVCFNYINNIISLRCPKIPTLSIVPHQILWNILPGVSVVSVLYDQTMIGCTGLNLSRL